MNVLQPAKCILNTLEKCFIFTQNTDLKVDFQRLLRLLYLCRIRTAGRRLALHGDTDSMLTNQARYEVGLEKTLSGLRDLRRN